MSGGDKIDRCKAITKHKCVNSSRTRPSLLCHVDENMKALYSRLNARSPLRRLWQNLLRLFQVAVSIHPRLFRNQSPPPRAGKAPLSFSLRTGHREPSGTTPAHVNPSADAAPCRPVNGGDIEEPLSSEIASNSIYSNTQGHPQPARALLGPEDAPGAGATLQHPAGFCPWLVSAGWFFSPVWLQWPRGQGWNARSGSPIEADGCRLLVVSSLGASGRACGLFSTCCLHVTCTFHHISRSEGLKSKHCKRKKAEVPCGLGLGVPKGCFYHSQWVQAITGAVWGQVEGRRRFMFCLWMWEQQARAEKGGALGTVSGDGHHAAQLRPGACQHQFLGFPRESSVQSGPVQILPSLLIFLATLRFCIHKP